jgi:hypothetical protein
MILVGSQELLRLLKGKCEDSTMKSDCHVSSSFTTNFSDDVNRCNSCYSDPFEITERMGY